MDAGHCRHCGRPFTSGEVTGTGILRPRSAERGGPRVEFACPGCKTVIPLVPHGNGRYAPPGDPPPPPPDEATRRVPWQRNGDAGGVPRTGTADAPPTVDAPPAGARAAAPPPPPASPPGEEPRRATSPRGPHGAPPTVPTNDPSAPMTAAEARALLGVTADADPDVVEAAYRALALKVHPDKVAHLDADFVALAEWKFRRLKAAHDRLNGARP